MKKYLFLVILALLVLCLAGCKKAAVEEKAAPTAPTVPEPTPPQPPVTAVIPEETTEATVQTSTKLEMVSEARCAANKIELRLTNPTQQTLTLGKDAKIILNGLVVTDPECDKLVVAPGESVFCSDISGHLSTKTGELNKVQINMGTERSTSEVDCKS
jgi:archaellum component FlaF (FlaF/FlaG flagellin family)